MYANLALSIYLSMQTGPVAMSDDSQPVPIVIELKAEGEDANVKVGKRVVVLAQVNEEEEESDVSRNAESRERDRGDRGRESREQGFQRRIRERAQIQTQREDTGPENIGGRVRFGSEDFWKLYDKNKDGVITPEELDEQTRDWTRIEKPIKISELVDHPAFGRTRGQVVREGDPGVEPPLGMGRMDRRLREQAERIERLEGYVRQLNERVERMQGDKQSDRDREQPRGGGWSWEESERRIRPTERRPTGPEARVGALEHALAQLKERAGGAENDRTRSVRQAIEARAEAERRKADLARRDHERKATAHMLEQIRANREQAKKQHEQQREAIAGQMRQAMERLEQSFKTSDAQMEKTIAELEKKLGELRGSDERAKRDR